jgi:FlaA1/EpsC-like NDP-sugar epimerase
VQRLKICPQGCVFDENREMNSIISPVFRKVSQSLIDLIVFALSLVGAYFIRFEGAIPDIFVKQIAVLLPYIIIARSISFQAFSVYKIVWRYISIQDVMRIIKGILPVTVLLTLARYFMPNPMTMLRIPISVISLEFLLVVLGTAGIRMVRRVSLETKKREDLTRRRNGTSKRVLLIGAGDAGNMVAKELSQRTDLGMEVAGFVDDDPKKFNAVIQGVRIFGSTAQIPEIVKRLKIDEAIITITNASSREIRRIVELCEGEGVKVKIVPGLFEMLDDRVKITKIREINIDDLLGRSVVDIETHHPDVEKHYRGKRILVTGAGGSIGSELCRQLCTYWPKELILIDKDENSIFEIDNELQGCAKGLRVTPIISNIKNDKQLETIFAKFRPEVIFHAAAHKHVPLMEFNVSEAILNNVHGTLNMAKLADRYGVESFIFISSDKAVNPTSVMGASKKVGEIIIQDIASKSGTKFACVRFGNVLGSRGSVVPLFQKQIARGGPVTVTHPDVQRFFMSIAEAVSLIIQAGSIGTKGEIFVLDMGKMVMISDLARDLIRLSGFKDDDIEIKYTGLRPGEKLYEEIMIDKERDKVTQFEKIFVTPPVEYRNDDLEKRLQDMVADAEKGRDAEIIRHFQEMGIGYQGDWRGGGR